MAATLQRNGPGLLLVVIGLALVAVANNIHFGERHWRAMLQADAKGYYAYLPAFFIYRDPAFGFLEAAEKAGSNPGLFYDYRVKTEGGTVNKYWAGTAMMQAPFFMVAHGIVKLSGAPADGYGRPYAIAIALAAIFYALAGLWAVHRLLAAHGVTGSAAAFVLVVLMFGTHLFYYTVVAPGMSHVYSFAVIGWTMVLMWRFGRSPHGRQLVLMGALIGLAVLVRPVNGLVICAAPFLMGRRSIVLGVQQHWKALGAGLLTAMAVVCIQPLTYFVSTGHWWVDSYPGEGFNWTGPHPVDFLFSYRKGLFVYTPVCLVALVGLVPLWRMSRFRAAAWAGLFLVLVYVFSAWWNWWYGGGFSARPFVEYLALFAIPLGMALAWMHGRMRWAYVAALVLLVCLCQIQTYQARYYRIHYEDMDKARYWDEFLRVDRLM